MTHIYERVFVDEYVVPYLERFFSPSAVTTEYRLPSDRRVDVMVQTPVFDVAIEAENDAESFDVGAGQALGYAEEVRRDQGVRPIPVLAVPVDPDDPDAHREDPEFAIARQLLREYRGDVIEVSADPDA